MTKTDFLIEGMVLLNTYATVSEHFYLDLLSVNERTKIWFNSRR